MHLGQALRARPLYMQTKRDGSMHKRVSKHVRIAHA